MRSPEQIAYDCLISLKDGVTLEPWMIKDLVNWRHPGGNDRVCEVVILLASMVNDVRPNVVHAKKDAVAVSQSIMSAISRASDLAIQSGVSFTRADVRVVVERVLRENRVCR